MKRNQWRTVGLAGLGIVALGIVGGLAGGYPSIAAIYPAFAGGVVGVVGAVALKAAKEHTELARAPAAPEPKP